MTAASKAAAGARETARFAARALGWFLLAGAPLWAILLLDAPSWLALFRRLDCLAFFQHLLLG